ncbi:hypothetical protein LX36DRAFT_723604 [Colletotrichum falcatum]|nr:hypothetical protein LX36DRAFT_723604 [Colletotrichum falcatum]
MANNLVNAYQNPPGQWVRPRKVPSITEILGCCPDYGDPQLAYRILGLQSTQQTPTAHRPDPADFTAWCNTVAQSIFDSAEFSKPGSIQQRRFLEANRRFLSAIHSIAGIRRPEHEDWRPDKKIRIAPWSNAGRCDDAPLDLEASSWDHMVVVPLPYNDFQRTYGSIKVAKKQQMAREEEKKRRAWLATRHMVVDAEKRELHDLKDVFSCYGFGAEPVFRFPQDKLASQKRALNHTFYAGPVPRDENSLWYSLAILVEDDPVDAKWIKGKVAEWFYENMIDPASERYRMYHHLLADSADSVDRDDVDDWGALDLLRCLNRNDVKAGMPREAGFHEMLHLVADYFDTEVITFTRPPYPSTYNDGSQGMKEWLQRHPYGMRVYGKQSSQENYRLWRFQDRKQILLVTDPELRYFQPVVRVAPELPRYEAGDRSLHGHYINTASFDVWDRHAPMPWWPGFQWDAQNGRWTGDWEHDHLRSAISVHRKLGMKPSDITTGVVMNTVNHSQMMGPYFKDEPQNVAPALRPLYNLRVSYVGDADSDRKALVRWNKASRLRWTAASPKAGQPLDPPPAVRDFDARIGSAQLLPRFPSKRQWSAMTSGGRDYLHQHYMGRHDSYGWLRLEATEVENRRPDWHDNKRRRKVAGSA